MAKEHDLYGLLGVPKTATQAEIKKQYRLLCLKLHPDKNPGDEEAKAKFQSLQRVYAILGDPDRRATFDKTGITDEDLAGDESGALFAYFSKAFRKVTEEDIDAFYDEYRGSDEEREDLLKLYKEHKGDMDTVFDYVMCSDQSLDSHRFMDMIREAIKEGKVKEFKSFKSWCKDVEDRPRPSDPLKKRGGGKKAGGGASGDLVLAIKQNRERSFHALMAHMESKYAGKEKKGKGTGKAPVAEPTDEEFEALQAKIMARSKGGDKAKAGRASQAKKGSKASKRTEIDIVSEEEDGNEEEESEDEQHTDEASESESEEEEAPKPKKKKTAAATKPAAKKAAKSEKGGAAAGKKSEKTKGASADKKKDRLTALTNHQAAKKAKQSEAAATAQATDDEPADADASVQVKPTTKTDDTKPTKAAAKRGKSAEPDSEPDEAPEPAPAAKGGKAGAKSGTDKESAGGKGRKRGAVSGAAGEEGTKAEKPAAKRARASK